MHLIPLSSYNVPLFLSVLWIIMGISKRVLSSLSFLMPLSPQIGKATLLGVLPIPIVGSAQSTINYLPMCVEGDEKKWLIGPIPYISGNFAIPGAGLLIMSSLTGSVKAKNLTFGGKKALLDDIYDIKFQVVAPAFDAATAVPDPQLSYEGGGKAKALPGFMNVHSG